MSPTSKVSHSISSNILKDVSAGSAGMIAGELAAEEEGLISKSTLASHQYGAMGNNETTPSGGPPRETSEDDLNGFALPKRELYTVIGSLFMASYLAALDTTVVTTLLSVIASDLNAVENISWIATAYLLSCSAFQPLFGKLSDIFGRKILLVICCIFFGVGCCICVTDSLLWLVFGRFITGCGGSGLTTLSTITMSDLIPLRERGLYQGLANICFGLGAASGGIIGGLVSDYLGWKYVFMLQVPLAAIVGLATYFFLNLPPGSPGLGAKGTEFRQKLSRVDFLGSVLLVTSLMLMLTAASVGGKELEYLSWSFISLIVISILLLVAFVYVEAKISKEPIIPMEVMTERTVLASSLTNWFYTMGVFAYLFYVPLYFQAGMGYTATQGGERLIPNFFAVSIGSVSAGLYMRKTGKYYNLVVGVGIMSILGMVRILYLSPKSSNLTQFTLLLVPGLGYLCILTVTLLALIAAVPSKYQACTTSIQYTFRSTGSTIGVAIASAVFQNVTNSQLQSRIHKLIANEKTANKVIEKAMKNIHYANEAPEVLKHAIRKAYQLGCTGTFVFSTVTIGLGYLSSLFMREHVLHTKMDRD